MSKRLDLDNNIQLWIPAYQAYRNGKPIYCPRCKSDEIETHTEDLGGGVGFVTLTCKSCNKTGYFSRVMLEKNIA